MENRAYVHDNGKAPASQNGYHDEIPTPDSHSNDKKRPLDEENDPWKVTSLSTNFTPWEELDRKRKIKRIIGYSVKIILVIGCLYMFICSLDFLSSAFKLLGGEAAGEVFQNNDIMTNPVAGLMMGVMVTVLVQSSSTSTSIVVSMVGAGILDIKTAIPIIMGANIGTSVTNTIVALGQISDEGEFRRAFAGATVHDMFNWLAVIILLPIEVATGMLFKLTEKIVKTLPIETKKGAKQDILKVVTKPFTEKIIQINKDAITQISKDEEPEIATDHVIMKICCDKSPPPPLDCCKNMVNGYTDAFKTTHANTTMRTQFCSEVNQCVTNLDYVPANCQHLPWEYQATHSELRHNLKCSALSSIASEIECCQQKLIEQIPDLGENQNVTMTQKTDVCSSSQLAGCFTGQTLTSAACLAKWETSNVTVLGKDSFSCVDWVHNSVNTTCNKPCDYLFHGAYPDLNDKQVGGILLVLALFLLCVCLVMIVKLLHSLLKGPIAVIIKKFVNADFPGPLGYLTGYLAILIGAGLTIVVQSSSIFTSSITPLVGIGVIELDRMYPLTLGSNIGTTTTSILSALANSGEKLRDSLQVAFAHLFFNIFGILIFYPFPFFRPPIPLAKFLGNCTAKYRWFAVVYIFAMFFIFPSSIFALSIAGWYIMAAVLIPIVLLIIIILIIKLIQNKKPKSLPTKLQNWTFLPIWFRSLAPYDKIMKKVLFCTRFQNKKEKDKGELEMGFPDSKIIQSTRI